MKKDVWNTNVVVCKLEPAFTKVIYLKRKKAKKKQEMIDKEKTEAIAKKRRENKRENILFIENDRYCNNDICNINLNKKIPSII